MEDRKGTDFLPALNGTYGEFPGKFTLPHCFAIEGGFEEIDRVFLDRLQDLGAYDLKEDAKTAIRFCAMKGLAEQAYEIHVENDIVQISASGRKGYGYGMTTLFQMVARGEGSIKNCILTDAPRFLYRGVMLDVCRHYFDIEEVKRVIEQAALLKLNYFHWHLSDDQGFRVESRQFPRLNEISSYRLLAAMDPAVQNGCAQAKERYGGYYTQEQIREVVRYASDRGVEIVPEIDLPGHSSAILAAYPQYTCTGKPLKVRNTFGIHDRIFCAGKQEAHDFLCRLIDELCGLFPGKYIHLGGDEAPKDEWRNCPDCGRMMRKKGYHDYEQLQCYFTERLVEYVKRKGKTAIVWNEAVYSGDLDSDALVQYWMEMAPGKSYVMPEVAKGRKFILSSMHHFYCSNSYAEMPLRATLMYEPQLKDGERIPMENVMGIEAPMWAEWTPENADIEKLLYPRLLAVSECGWTERRSIEDFERRAKDFLETKGLNILAPIAWEEATISGQEALRIIVVNMVQMGRKYGNMSQGEDKTEAGRVEAVTPDGEESEETADMADMVRTYIAGFMKEAYTEAEIDQVVEMVRQMMDGQV